MKVFTESLFTLPEVEVADDFLAYPALVIGIFEDKVSGSEFVQKIKVKKKVDIIKVLQRKNFTGKEKQVFSFDLSEEQKVIFVGLGREDAKEWEKKENIRRASGNGVVLARDSGYEEVCLCGFEGYEREALEGALLGLYRFKKYKLHSDSEKDEDEKTDDEKLEKEVKKIFLYTQKKKDEAKNIIDFTRIICEAQNFARDIVNEPGNVINPLTLSEIASGLAEKYGLGCEIFDIEEIKKMGMGGVIAVGQGSSIPPKVVHIWWKPSGEPKDKIAFIGKAITFDSGGLSLKPQNSMVTMKLDKAGACAVLGAMKSIAILKPQVEVHGLFAACENMPSGTAQRPDDIIKIMDGKSVEVINTDAEGRLTLADMLVFAGRLGVSKIVDLATLTGACMVALGEFTAGLMGNSEKFNEFIFKLARDLGEKVWILPLDKDLEEKLKSDFAFIKNVGDGYGGAITAAIFLSKFVPKGVEWVHLDIAGPAFLNKKLGYFSVKGGTGFGVRTLVELTRKIENGEY